MIDYEFDDRLETARTPPSSWYFDPGVFAAERRLVFGATWQLVGRLEQLANPGDYFTTEVGGEPVLVSRTQSGGIIAMSNVCRHRAGPVASGQGNCRSFRCGYHGWIYSLEGKLMATPEFSGVEDFSRADHPLPRFRCESWLGLVFVNLRAEGPGLLEEMGELVPILARRDLSAYRLARSKDWTIRCNWKVYVDNYLEGYHIPIVHPSLFEELDYANYRTETRGGFSIQHSPIKAPVHLRKENPEDEAEYYWIYPNLMLNVYPDNFSTNVILAPGPSETITVFEWYFKDPESAATQKLLDDTVAFSDLIQIEDIAICETVQKGLASSTYSQGRYSKARENGVHHFHGLLWRALSKR